MYRGPISALLIVLLATTAALAATQPVTADPVPVPPQSAPEVASRHECCHPLAHFKLELVPPEFPKEMPCGGRHSCCMSSSPECSANVPSTLTWERPGATDISVVVPTALPGSNSCIPPGTPSAHLLPYSRFSTVLRI